VISISARDEDVVGSDDVLDDGGAVTSAADVITDATIQRPSPTCFEHI